jgi:osmotically-inducible protein OsmY
MMKFCYAVVAFNSWVEHGCTVNSASTSISGSSEMKRERPANPATLTAFGACIMARPAGSGASGCRASTATQRKEHRSMSNTSVATPRVGQALRQSPIPALRHLQVEETEREVVLSGSVATYYMKQLAQEAVMPLLGDRMLQNRVLVVRSS